MENGCIVTQYRNKINGRGGFSPMVRVVSADFQPKGTLSCVADSLATVTG
jgi:hypothetical protein